MGSRFILSLWLVFLASAGWATCSEDSVSLRGPFGEARFRVAVADTAAERSRGLMFVDQMAQGVGMLFVYDNEQPVAFWMRNTLIPLDMIFADAEGRVIKVHENAVPHDETPIPSDGPAQFVLEINGGLSRRLGIAAGAEMRHPAIAQASWPCPAE